MTGTKETAQGARDTQNGKERLETIDFKMITFSLAGKDYGVDIMNVKEIAKADKFTFVPNASPFVKGVYNLRGDIIPIIDLRAFFHLPADRAVDGVENMLILRIQDRVYGTIVDKIDKVIGLNSGAIQPPHPIFGDINIKFISGVVEKDGDLYILLDMVRIFTPAEDDKPLSLSAVPEALPEAGAGAAGDAAAEAGLPSPAFSMAPSPAALPAAALPEGPPAEARPEGPSAEAAPEAGAAAEEPAAEGPSIEALGESLVTLAGFYPSPVNEAWLRARAAEWAAAKWPAAKGAAAAREYPRLSTQEEAEEFLAPFHSPDTGRLWSAGYAERFKSILPERAPGGGGGGGTIQVWNIGCGKGFETYSLVCVLKERYPGARLKVWANDRDIMRISEAPNMVFAREEIPSYCKPYTSKGRNGYTFTQEVQDAIVFEYHDALNPARLPALDIIVVRDVLSCLPPEDQERLTAAFAASLNPGGLVAAGKNEALTAGPWLPAGNETVSAFVLGGETEAQGAENES